MRPGAQSTQETFLHEGTPSRLGKVAVSSNIQKSHKMRSKVNIVKMKGQGKILGKELNETKMSNLPH